MHLDLVMVESTVLGAQHPALKLDKYAKPFWEPSVSAGCQAVSMGGDSETGRKDLPGYRKAQMVYAGKLGSP